MDLSSSVYKVETIEVTNNINKIVQDASNNPSTKNNIYSKSISLGTLAPGENSLTRIFYLNLPLSLGIGNIKLGLIDIDDIEFQNNIFGIGQSRNIIHNYTPTYFFQGLNPEKNPQSPYNYAIKNYDFLRSNYIYIKVNLPLNLSLGIKIIRYCWFFDYDSAIG